VHERPDRGPAPGRRARRRAAGASLRARDGRPGLGGGATAGGGGRARRGLPARRVRVAAGRMLDVPGDEPGRARTRRALRLDVQPQLRGPAGSRRQDPPRQPGHGRGRGVDRPADVREVGAAA
jgi:hypothetical protein